MHLFFARAMKIFFDLFPVILFSAAFKITDKNPEHPLFLPPCPCERACEMRKCVSPKRSRQNDDFPVAWMPMKMSNSMRVMPSKRIHLDQRPSGMLGNGIRPRASKSSRSLSA
jgi:hypothetical protein